MQTPTQVTASKMAINIAMTAALATVSCGAIAADWTIVQTASITTAAPDLKQGDTTIVTSSVQSINGVQLEVTADNLASDSSQSTTFVSGTSVTLTQGPNVSGVAQAVNYIDAQNIADAAAGDVSQLVTTTQGPDTALTQSVTGTASLNVQALNIATAATGTIYDLAQGVIESGSLTLTQDAVASAENTQGVNYAAATTIGSSTTRLLEQTASVTEDTTLNQGATGGSNLQAANIAVALTTTGKIAFGDQDFTATANLDLEQDMTTGNTNFQGINYLDTAGNAAGNIEDVDQQVTAGGTITVTASAGSSGNVQALNLARSGTDVDGLTQTVTFSTGTAAADFNHSADGADNIQSGNYVIAEGNIDSLSQTYSAGGVADLDWDQTGTGNSGVQAGNMAIIDGTSFTIENITQTFTASGTQTTFDQSGTADNLIQSGNLLDIGTGNISDTAGNVQQVFTTADAGSVALAQSGTGSKNLQALNATVDTTGGSGTTDQSLSQSVTTTGLFTMAQNAVSNSGQFANFAGLKY